jgi:uncharacterized surface protein with fasciclin (FAS1) repeats
MTAAIITLNAPVNVETLPGRSVLVSIDGKKLKVSDATVFIPDVVGSHGINHPIDTMLIPSKLQRLSRLKSLVKSL